MQYGQPRRDRNLSGRLRRDPERMRAHGPRQRAIDGLELLIAEAVRSADDAMVTRLDRILRDVERTREGSPELVPRQRHEGRPADSQG